MRKEIFAKDKGIKLRKRAVDNFTVNVIINVESFSHLDAKSLYHRTYVMSHVFGTPRYMMLSSSPSKRSATLCFANFPLLA